MAHITKTSLLTSGLIAKVLGGYCGSLRTEDEVEESQCGWGNLMTLRALRRSKWEGESNEMESEIIGEVSSLG